MHDALIAVAFRSQARRAAPRWRHCLFHREAYDDWEGACRSSMPRG